MKNKIISIHNTDNSNSNVVLLYDVKFFVVSLEEKCGCSSCRKVENKLKYKDRTI